jgi:NitT/TauT family transport system permease protein
VTGLAFFIMFSTSFIKIPTVVTSFVVLVAMSLVLFRLVGLLQRRLVRSSLPKSHR